VAASNWPFLRASCADLIAPSISVGSARIPAAACAPASGAGFFSGWNNAVSGLLPKMLSNDPHPASGVHRTAIPTKAVCFKIATLFDRISGIFRTASAAPIWTPEARLSRAWRRACQKILNPRPQKRKIGSGRDNWQRIWRQFSESPSACAKGVRLLWQVLLLRQIRLGLWSGAHINECCNDGFRAQCRPPGQSNP